MLKNDDWEKVQSLSDKELGDKISIAVKALGGGKGDLKLSDADLAKIKNAVRGMKLADVNAVMNKLDPQKAQAIKDTINSSPDV